MAVGLLLLALLVTVATGQRGKSVWNCSVVDHFVPGRGVAYQALNCTGAPAPGSSMTWRVGPTVFHLVLANLSAVQVTAVTADPTAQLQIVPDMMPPGALAGINGGYFWEVLNQRFFDNVCIGKLREEAEQPCSEQHPNRGRGDTLVRIKGQLMSTNCDLLGFSHPVAFVMNGTASYLVPLRRGQQLDVPDALANSPLLVLGGRYAIPVDDLGLNRWSHSANAAVALRGQEAEAELILVASDGRDSCPRSDPSCGIDAEPMAYFMLDVVQAEQAVELDQGGSTTLWVKGLGIVNNNRNSPRKVFSGIAVM
jgi:hypothetical protein